MGLFGKRRDAAEEASVADRPVPPAPRQPIAEGNVVKLMRGVDEELAAVDSGAQSALRDFIASLSINSRPEGAVRMEGMSDPIEGYRMEIADHRVIWSLGPHIPGTVLVMRIFKLS
jgi:hypothetical protein